MLDVNKHLMQDHHIHRRHLYYSTAPQTNTLCNLTVIVQSALSYQALKFEFNVSQSENLHLYCHRVAIFILELFSALATLLIARLQVSCYCSAWLKSQQKLKLLGGLGIGGAVSGIGTFSRSRRRSLISIERRISSSLRMLSLLISLPRSTLSPSVHRQNCKTKNKTWN